MKNVIVFSGMLNGCESIYPNIYKAYTLQIWFNSELEKLVFRKKSIHREYKNGQFYKHEEFC